MVPANLPPFPATKARKPPRKSRKVELGALAGACEQAKAAKPKFQQPFSIASHAVSERRCQNLPLNKTHQTPLILKLNKRGILGF